MRERTRAQGLSRGATALIAAMLAAAACDDSGGGSPKPSPTEKFIGTWTVSSGMASAPTCGFTQKLDGTVVSVTAGSDAPLQLTVAGCVLKFDVKDDVATARTGQTCNSTFMVMGLSIPATLTVDSSMFTVTATGGQLAQTGTAMVTSPLTLTCPYTITAMGAKGAAADGGAAD